MRHILEVNGRLAYECITGTIYIDELNTPKRWFGPIEEDKVSA